MSLLFLGKITFFEFTVTHARQVQTYLPLRGSLVLDIQDCQEMTLDRLEQLSVYLPQ